MTSPIVYALTEMKILLKADKPTGVWVEGTISKLHTEISIPFLHTLTSDEAKQIGEVLLGKDEERAEFRNMSPILKIIISDNQTDEWFLMPPFFPIENATQSTLLCLTYDQAREYGPSFQEKAHTAERISLKRGD